MNRREDMQQAEKNEKLLEGHLDADDVSTMERPARSRDKGYRCLDPARVVKASESTGDRRQKLKHDKLKNRDRKGSK